VLLIWGGENSTLPWWSSSPKPITPVIAKRKTSEKVSIPGPEFFKILRS
jgi:hypothetical protein